MTKFLVLIALLLVYGCKTLPQFPVVWFWSHADLLKQEREINRGFKKENN